MTITEYQTHTSNTNVSDLAKYKKTVLATDQEFIKFMNSCTNFIPTNFGESVGSYRKQNV